MTWDTPTECLDPHHWTHSIQRRIRSPVENELGLEEIECQKELQSQQKITSTHGFLPIVCIHTALDFGTELCLNTKTLCFADRH